jgi:hypothetical protein
MRRIFWFVLLLAVGVGGVFIARLAEKQWNAEYGICFATGWTALFLLLALGVLFSKPGNNKKSRFIRQ